MITLPLAEASRRHNGGRPIAAGDHHSSCYFRTAPEPGTRKALVQITERCNLHCAHCFVSSTKVGLDLCVEQMDRHVLPLLEATNVQRVTLTGGEPFVHPDLLAIASHLKSMSSVTICTNATLIESDLVRRLAELGNVRVNVSLDGFSAAVHDRLRGQRGAFDETMRGLSRLASHGLVKGILATPTAASTPEDFARLQELGSEVDAEFVLMNPLSPLGRGVGSARKLGATDHAMRAIEAAVEASTAGVEPVFIRFPPSGRPLSGCFAGDIYYIFANGDVAFCPYLVFAARSPASKHDVREFLAGNLFGDENVADRICRFNPASDLRMGSNPTCQSCGIAATCGKGCPAAVVAAGGRVGDHDTGACDRR